jgi:hypothetical protein
MSAYIHFSRDVDQEAEFSFDRATIADYSITLADVDNDPNSQQPSYAKSYVLCANFKLGAVIITYHVFVDPFITIGKMLTIEMR